MRRRALKILFSPLRTQRGMALLMALASILLMTFVAMEVSYDTNVEYLIASQQVNRLKAYYSARAGVELSLLRVLIYKKALAAMSAVGGNTVNATMLDPIWQFPFTWPPVLPDDLSSVDKNMIQSVVKESSFTGQYLATIEAEGGQIDVNDLGSDLKQLQKSTQLQILKIFESQMRNNEDFARDYAGFNFEELVNNITDWVDADEESRNGGGESSLYRDELQSEFIPPNQPFKTIEELHMVAGMTDELYDLLAPRLTVFGVKGININYANKDVLSGLDPSMTEEAVSKIIERRSNPDLGGPFTNEDDFFNFARSYNVDTEAIKQSKLPLYFGAEFNFRIRSTGQFANVTREITVVTYDYDNLVERYNKLFEQEQKDNEGETKSPPTGDENEESATSTDSPDQDKPSMPKGRPTIVYWEEN